MATIKITNLNPTGSELFHDSESYLNELTDEEMNLTGGILFPSTGRSFPIRSIGFTITRPFPIRPTIVWRTAE